MQCTAPVTPHSLMADCFTSAARDIQTFRRRGRWSGVRELLRVYEWRVVAARFTSHVTCYTSHVTRHTSHITHHTPHITHHRLGIRSHFRWPQRPIQTSANLHAVRPIMVTSPIPLHCSACVAVHSHVVFLRVECATLLKLKP